MNIRVLAELGFENCCRGYRGFYDCIYVFYRFGEGQFGLGNSVLAGHTEVSEVVNVLDFGKGILDFEGLGEVITLYSWKLEVCCFKRFMWFSR